MYSHQIVHRVNWLLLTYQITGLAYISYFFSFSPVTQPYMLKINAYIASKNNYFNFLSHFNITSTRSSGGSIRKLQGLGNIKVLKPSLYFS